MSLSLSFPKAILGVIIICISFIVIVLTINSSLFDETLDPEVVEYLKPTQMPADNENAYFSLMGLTAEDGKNMNQAGKQLITRYQNNVAQKGLDELTDNDYQEILGNTDLDDEWKELIPNCVARKGTHCTTELVSRLYDNQEMKLKLESNQRLSVMRTRYQTIIQMSQFQQVNHLTFTSPLPSYSEIMKLSQLELAEAYHSDDFDHFITKVSLDLKFWRMMLDKGDTLIDKMIAIVRIWGNLQTISEYVSKMDTISENQNELLNNLLTPLTKEELDVSEAFIFEQRFFYQSLNHISAEELGSIFSLPAYPPLQLTQINATVNSYYRYFIKEIIEMSHLNAKDFYKKIKDEENCCFQEIKKLNEFSLSNLYNLGGKSILTVTIFNAEDYIARVHDLNGVFDLLKLKLSLENTDRVDIKQFISNSEITNQYTGKPIEFDSSKNTLSFECLNKDSLCEVIL